MADASGPKPIDQGRFDLLYRRYGAMVLRRARRILADEHLAHDVCQEVFIQILRSPDWDAASPVGWLFRTTTNCCLNLIRGKRRWQSLLRLMPRPAPAMPSLPVQLLLRGVPERLHDVAIYYGLDRMSQDEIALALGISQKTVSNRLRELRAWLEDEESNTKARQP